MAITEKEAIRAVVESAEFAADILKTINAARLLGVKSLAGQAIEAESRLRANVALLKGTDKRWIEDETRLRVLKALQLDESHWKAGSMHAHGFTCFVESEVETIADALLIAERSNPVSLANTAEYKSTFWPLDDFERRATLKTYRDNEPYDVTPWIGKLTRSAEYSARARWAPVLNPAEFELHFGVKIETESHGVEFIQHRVKVKNFAPIRHEFRRSEHSAGGYASSVSGMESHFTKRYMLWAEAGTPNDFVLVA